MSCDQRIDQSATSIQSLLKTNGATFLMTSHVRSALWTLHMRLLKNFLPIVVSAAVALVYKKQLVKKWHVTFVQMTPPGSVCPASKLEQNLVKNPSWFKNAFIQVMPLSRKLCEASNFLPNYVSCINLHDNSFLHL